MAVIMNNSSKQTSDVGKEDQKRHILRRCFLYLKNGNLSSNEHFYEIVSHHLADFETMIAFLITLLMVAA